MDNKFIGKVAAVVFLMGSTAAIASYTTRESLQSTPVNTVSNTPATVSNTPVNAVSNPTVQSPPKRHSQQMAAAQPQQPACDDKNIVGTVAGGAAGGLVGSQIGKGSGNTAAIIGGVVGGALVGNQYIPTRNVTCQH